MTSSALHSGATVAAAGSWEQGTDDGNVASGDFRAVRADGRWALEMPPGSLALLSDAERDLVAEEGGLSRWPPGRGWFDAPPGLLLRPETWHMDAWETWQRRQPLSPDHVAGRQCTVFDCLVAVGLQPFRLWVDDATGSWLRLVADPAANGTYLNVTLTQFILDDPVPPWAVPQLQILEQLQDPVQPAIHAFSASVEAAAEVLLNAVADTAGASGTRWYVEVLHDEPPPGWTLALSTTAGRVAEVDCRSTAAPRYRQRRARIQTWPAGESFTVVVDYGPPLEEDDAIAIVRAMATHVRSQHESLGD